MFIHYDVPRLKEILYNLMKLTGISLAFLDTEYNFLCNCTREDSFCAVVQRDEAVRDKCRCSGECLLKRCIGTRRVESHLCHAGLFDAVMPIVKDNIVVGFVVLGRIRTPQSCPQEVCTADGERLSLWMALPSYSDEQIDSLKSLLPNILLDNAIEIEYSNFAREVTAFIEQHLADKLSLEILCGTFFVSKNKLYRIFHEKFNCTVNEYIVDLRIKRACNLLRNTDIPVSAVAASVGMENYPYFCRVFRNRMDMTPGEYRRN